MKRTVPGALVIGLIPTVILLCGYSCAVPLAPGYQILKELCEVRFVPSQPSELRIHAFYRLQNVGNGDLTFLDADFPGERPFGRKDLRVEIDGRAAVLESLPIEYQTSEPNRLRIPLKTRWERKQVRDLSVEYTLASPENSGSRITLGENEFHLGSRGWFPELQPPRHMLAPYPKSLNPVVYTIRVPADFLVLARGTSKDQKREGDEVQYRFELSKNDLPPFVVAGKYVSAPLNRHPHSAALWTLQPLKDDAAPAAEQIAAAWNTLATDFGSPDRNIAHPHIVESPELRGHIYEETGPAAAAFPGGAIVNPAALALGINSHEFLELVTHALAHNWFGDELRPSSDSSIGIGEGLPEYATIVIDEARDGPAGRRRRVTEYLRRFDEARALADETPLGVTMLTDPIGPQRIALAKAPLFYIALEDACGPAEFRKGLASVVALLRGQEIDYNDLRSALEQSTRRNLGKMFRLWLNEKGIPRDFRDRYPLAPASEETGE